MSIVKLFQSRTKPKERFEILVRPHIGGLYRLAFLLCQSQNDAEELVQQLLTKLFPKTASLENIESLKPWLSRALYNLYIDNYRSGKRHMDLFDDNADVDEELARSRSPAEYVENQIERTNIYDALDSLNNDQRMVVLLHDVEGYTLQEIECILQAPLGTLKSRLNRARNQLKNLLAMEPYSDTERVKGTR